MNFIFFKKKQRKYNNEIFSQGDVQMCVTLMLVLSDRIKIGEERVEQWFFSYIGKYTILMRK
jgi:hypothetical protein